MPIITLPDGSFAFVPLTLHPDKIGPLLEDHAQAYPGSAELEAQGLKLIECDFEEQASRDFVSAVCNWGRGPRWVTRILDCENRVIPDALRRGYKLCQKGRVAEGVVAIQAIRGLGLSFASKQLRFLCPKSAVILDSVIRNGLGYAESENGYTSFATDCRSILNGLPDNLTNCQGFSLRVCDVEAAIFTKLRNLRT